MIDVYPTVAEGIRVLITVLISFFVALLGTPFIVRLLHKVQAKKQIRTTSSAPIFCELHKNKEGTPTMGGIIIWGTVLGIAVVFWILDALFDGFFGYFNFIDRAQTYLPLAAFFFAALLGLIDDILGSMRVGPNGGGLPVRGKLVVYTLFSMVGAWWFYTKLGFTEIHVPFFGTYDIGFWYVLVFMFAIIASAFSANETDGLDGLLGGVSLFAYGALIVVAFVIGRYDLATMGAAIVGALLAFLWFNIYPAKFFMGDTGSMALGITIGVIAMLTNTILLLPFFAAILVFESLSVIIQLSSKKIRGKKVFRSTPIHHHFEAIGWPESQITMRFWIVSVVFVALGLFIFFIDRLL